MVLVCALATTLTLLVQQAANMGALDTQATTNASSHTTATASPSDRDSTPSTAAPEPSPSASDNKQDTLVNINTADEAQLQEIKGIGPVTAARIIEYRTQHGAFASLDDLVNVPGIGMKTVEKLRACDREHRGIAGSRDLRMLPVAAGVWSATLLTRWVCSQHGSGHDVFWQHGRMLQMACLAVASAAIFIALVLIPLTMNGAGKHHGLAVDRAHRMLYTLLTVCFAILAATLATAARSLTEHADPVNMSASSSTERVNLTFTAHSLPLATSMGGYDCQVDGNARSIVRHDVRRPSSRGVRVFARQPACGRIAQQGDYAIVGTIQAAAYGEMPIWVLADGDMMAVKEPPAPWRAVHRIRMAFLQTTRGLDNPGVVLVPGVTLGVLGHDAMVHCADGGVEDEYAELLQEQCRRAGIMHLMAVSGGHYALVGTLVMGLGARLHWNRFVKAGALAMVYPMLTMVLAPSRSVTRAMLMSMLSLGFLMLGRRRQSVHLLCLTVVFGLLLDPSLASSYGFALSCAAVFGLSTACTRMTAWVSHLLPDRLAKLLAASCCAQLFAGPVQILMDNEVSIWSLPANLLVAPFVDAATILGLCSLFVAWMAPGVSRFLAWACSQCTTVIEYAARLFGSEESSTLAWMEGIPGAAVLIVTELTTWALIVCIGDLLRAYDDTVTNGDGRPMRMPVRERLTQWFEHTLEMMGWLTWRR